MTGPPPDRRWGRGAAVTSVAWIAAAGLLLAVVVSPVLDWVGARPHDSEDWNGLLLPVVLAVIGAGGLRAIDRRAS